MNNRRSDFFLCMFLIFFTIRIIGGVLWVETFEQEGYVEVFIKKRPTAKYFIFSDPYASDPIKEPHAYGGRMDELGNWKSGTGEFENFSIYCNYRFGIYIDGTNSRDQCKVLAKKGGVRWTWPYLIYLLVFDLQ